MYCYKCGQYMSDDAIFCSKCGTKKYQETDNQNSLGDEHSRKKELTIEAVEVALLKATKPEDRILLLKIAGDAYASGDIGATKDALKAIQKYKEAADLGSIECEHLMGVTYIYTYWGMPGDEAEINFSLGVAHVCWSYKKGYTPAGETLQYLLDQGVFPSCKTIADLLDLSTVI